MGRKLKRFLLRYDPPGLGIEIAEGDIVDVVHKDLPAPATIQSVQDILRAVEDLIDEESDFLSKKRHRPALIQLLGRLYQVDVTEAEELDRGSPGGRAGSVSPKVVADLPWQEGNNVVLIHLKGEQMVHNGELGVLVKIKHDKKKYEVLMDKTQETVKIRAEENIALVWKVSLSVGAAVVIRGLRNHTELNGCLGRVVECHSETHRFEVRAIESGQLFRVKQENVVPVDASVLPAQHAPPKEQSPRKDKLGAVAADAGSGGDDHGDVFEAGSQVELQGLKTAMAYNGQSAEVLSVDRVRCRYEIRLTDGSVKTVRAENVRLVAGASKSPRRRGKEGGTRAADRGT